MTNWTSYSVRNITQRLQSLAAVLLVLIYVVANVEFEAIHEAFHQHDAHVTHSVIDEQDPCHISLYHQSDGKGCHHKAHVSVGKKCPLCHIHHVGDKLFLTTTVTVDVAANQIARAEYTISLVTQVTHLLPSRGPPSIV